MQMETRAVTSIANITYNLSCRYRFSCGNGSLRHMGIPRRQARAVVQQNLVAVTVVPAGNDNCAAVGRKDGGTLRCRNVGAAMAGVAVGVGFTEVAGNIGVTGQRPAEVAVLDDADTVAEGEQGGAHFGGEEFVQYVVLVLGEIVQLRQFVHGFAADGDVQDVVGFGGRVGVVLGGFGGGVYFFDFVGDAVHGPKGVLDSQCQPYHCARSASRSTLRRP